MRSHYPKDNGPLKERIFLTERQVDEACAGALEVLGLMPKEPGPVDIDRFVENRFGFYEFDDLAPGVLGYTKFSRNGVERVVISKELGEGTDKVSKRRVRTTLAHEAGHGLFHAPLFAVAHMDHRSMFEDVAHDDTPRILCRDVHDEADGNRPRSKWFEIQANMAIGSLLLPRSVFERSLRPYLAEAGGFLGGTRFDEKRRAEAIRDLAELFNVNPRVVRIRLESVFPVTMAQQGSL